MAAIANGGIIAVGVRMQGSDWKDRVAIDPGLRHGEPCIRGTRISVAAIIGSLADGMSEDEIRKAYPQLTTEDVRAALAYAAEAVRFETLASLP
jgi:uncharacterized protein (DUF433 family)